MPLQGNGMAQCKQSDSEQRQGLCGLQNRRRCLQGLCEKARLLGGHLLKQLSHIDVKVAHVLL